MGGVFLDVQRRQDEGGGEWRSDRKKSILVDIPNNTGKTILIGHSDKRVSGFDLFLFQALGIRYVTKKDETRGLRGVINQMKNIP